MNNAQIEAIIQDVLRPVREQRARVVQNGGWNSEELREIDTALELVTKVRRVLTGQTNNLRRQRRSALKRSAATSLRLNDRKTAPRLGRQAVSDGLEALAIERALGAMLNHPSTVDGAK